MNSYSVSWRSWSTNEKTFLISNKFCSCGTKCDMECNSIDPELRKRLFDEIFYADFIYCKGHCTTLISRPWNISLSSFVCFKKGVYNNHTPQKREHHTFGEWFFKHKSFLHCLIKQCCGDDDTKKNLAHAHHILFPTSKYQQVFYPKMTWIAAIRVENTTNEKATLINTHLQASIKFWCEMEFRNYPFDVQVIFHLDWFNENFPWYSIESIFFRNVSLGWEAIFTKQPSWPSDYSKSQRTQMKKQTSIWSTPGLTSF